MSSAYKVPCGKAVRVDETVVTTLCSDEFLCDACTEVKQLRSSREGLQKENAKLRQQIRKLDGAIGAKHAANESLRWAVETLAKAMR